MHDETEAIETDRTTAAVSPSMQSYYISIALSTSGYAHYDQEEPASTHTCKLVQPKNSPPQKSSVAMPQGVSVSQWK